MTAADTLPDASVPSAEAPARESALTPVVTLVLWLGCLLIGAIGFILPYSRPRPLTPPVPIVQAQLIKVELQTALIAPPVFADSPPPTPTQPPPLFIPALPPQAPQLIAVALPTPTVAFALPIEAPSRVVELNHAAFVRPPTQPKPTSPGPAATPGSVQSNVNNGASPVVETLTYGQGEGRQPAPEYPLPARRAGQEGTVVIRFSVGTDGRVLSAEPSAPSPWAALNREALKVVRERWSFQPGPVRLHEVAIRFELKK